MLLAKLVELKLFTEDPDSNIIKEFPLEARRNIIYETNKHISSNIHYNSATLTSAAHVNWVMEIIGQGLLTLTIKVSPFQSLNQV
jgi:hypothetical protein